MQKYILAFQKELKFINFAPIQELELKHFEWKESEWELELKDFEWKELEHEMDLNLNEKELNPWCFCVAINDILANYVTKFSWNNMPLNEFLWFTNFYITCVYYVIIITIVYNIGVIITITLIIHGWLETEKITARNWSGDWNGLKGTDPALELLKNCHSSSSSANTLVKTCGAPSS